MAVYSYIIVSGKVSANVDLLRIIEAEFFQSIGFELLIIINFEGYMSIILHARNTGCWMIGDI